MPWDYWSGKLQPKKNPYDNLSVDEFMKLVGKPTFRHRDHWKTHPYVEQNKKMIDNPTSFEGGVRWSRAEKNELKQAEADYKEIQDEAKNINLSLDKIDSLLDIQKTRQSTEIAEYVRNIESILNEIDRHLSEYKDKLKLFEEKTDNKTDEEIAWEIEANKLISQLITERDGLSNSLTEIHSLQANLDDTRGRVEDNGIRLSICDLNSVTAFPFINWLSRLSR